LRLISIIASPVGLLMRQMKLGEVSGRRSWAGGAKSC
jgi:hypothetical protein